MVISWWRSWWWRQRDRASSQPLRLHQRRLSLENLEDRRLLSAVLTPDPLLQALDGAKSPTAQVALVRAAPTDPARDGITSVPMVVVTATQAAPDSGSSSDGNLLILATPANSRGDRPSHRRHHHGANASGLASGSVGQPDSPVRDNSSSISDATFATGLLPVADAPANTGWMQLASPTDPGSGLLNTDASLAGSSDSSTGGSTSGQGDLSSTTTTGDSQVPARIAPDSGSGATLNPVNATFATDPSLTPAGVLAVDLQAIGGHQDQNGTGDLSGGDTGITSGGAVAIDPSATGTTAASAGDVVPGNLGLLETGSRAGKSGGGDQGSTSNGSRNDTGSGDDSTSSGSDDSSTDNSGDQSGHGWINNLGNADEQTGTTDASAGTDHHHAGRHGHRDKGSDSTVAGTQSDQGAIGTVASADSSAADETTSLSTDTQGGQASGSDGASLVVDAASSEPASAPTVGRRHHHHRYGPFAFPINVAGDLNSYTATIWGQDPDAGMDGSEDYFQQSFTYTTTIGNVVNFRPDSLAHGEKTPDPATKADWRYLGSQIRTARVLVLIGWGNAGPTLATGEGTIEGLDLVYTFQAASNRSAEVTGIHRIRARVAKSHDLGPEDRSLALAESGRFFAARSLPPIGVGRTTHRSSWTVAVPAPAAVDQGPIERLAAGSFLARHFNTDGDSPGDSQRLDGRGWWYIVSQFILAPQFPRNHQPTIMLAVADEASRDALNVALVKNNFLVLTAATARDAINLLRTPLSPVDVALLDVHLPDVNGVDLCGRLRELYPTLPVLVCTDQAEQGDVTQLMKFNVLRIFSKPVAIGDLLAAVKGIVS